MIKFGQILDFSKLSLRKQFCQTTSQDSGATFGSTINLSNNPASLSYNPQIVASGENVYIVWEDDDGESGN